MSYLTIVLYLTFSATGLLLIKIGSGDIDSLLRINLFNLAISWLTLLGIFFYGISFILFLVIIPKYNLTYIYPLAAGLLYVVIVLAGIYILGERLTFFQSIGAVLILIGIVAINAR